MKDLKHMSKEEYVSWHKEKYFRCKEAANQPIELNVLRELISQWEFDYEMEQNNW